jgi:hypothetical protein
MAGLKAAVILNTLSRFEIVRAGTNADPTDVRRNGIAST